MRAAPGPRRGARMLVVDPVAGRWADAAAEDLPTLLTPDDLLVLNDAGTFPASLHGTVGRSGPGHGSPIELRLLALPDPASGRASAILFGPGDWRTPTEHRPPADLNGCQELILDTYASRSNRAYRAPECQELILDTYASGGSSTRPLTATLESRDPRSDRLATVRFDRTGPALLRALFALGSPVQYSYLADDLPLHAVQTPFAGPPVSIEMPSAGRALSPTVLAAARRRGVRLATLTHAAGLSSTGDDALDALLPLPERYWLPTGTRDAVLATHARGGRVIAVGTTVVRALEGAARAGFPAEGVTDLVLDAHTPLHVVDGLVSGVHVPGESHFRVLAAAAPDALLRDAVGHAELTGYLAHEFGDTTLVLPGALRATRTHHAERRLVKTHTPRHPHAA